MATNHLRSDSEQGDEKRDHNHIDAPPKHWTRFFWSIVLSVVLFIAALAGAYVLTVHETGLQDQARARATAARNAKEKALAQKTAILASAPLCRGLILMDDASHGASNASNQQNSYGHKLARAITVVVNDSGCRILINDLNHHVPFPQIAKDLAKAAKAEK